MQSPLKSFSSLWIGIIASTVVTTVITIWAELVPALKTWLGSTFLHHWVGKSIIGLSLFVIIVLIGLVRKKEASAESQAHLIRLTTWVVILSSVVLFGYYLWHTIETKI